MILILMLMHGLINFDVMFYLPDVLYDAESSASYVGTTVTWGSLIIVVVMAYPDHILWMFCVCCRPSVVAEGTFCASFFVNCCRDLK